jgi:hypothetical protein
MIPFGKGNTGNQPDNFFIKKTTGGQLYLAIVNYSDSLLNYTIDPLALGLNTNDKGFTVKELFSGTNTTVKEKFNVMVKASDAAIYRSNIQK